jgi:hypothetical protein
MEAAIRWLHDAPLTYALIVLLGENVLLLIVALLGGLWATRRWANQPVALTRIR